MVSDALAEDQAEGLSGSRRTWSIRDRMPRSDRARSYEQGGRERPCEFRGADTWGSEAGNSKHAALERMTGVDLTKAFLPAVSVIVLHPSVGKCEENLGSKVAQGQVGALNGAALRGVSAGRQA